jgi:antitoxin MazE
MTTTISRVGDRLALLLPPELGAPPGFGPDATVEVTVENGALVARPPGGRRRYTLEELVAGITPENRHPETDTGPAVGREVL